MSNQKSWDKNVTSDGTAYHLNTNVPVLSKPARLVGWPEGAPPQNEVPHAGEKVQTEGGTPFTVQSGIPYIYQGMGWYLRVYYEGRTSGSTIARKVTELKRYVPEPERTFTEAEIRAAYKTAGDRGVYVNNLIKDLKKRGL